MLSVHDIAPAGIQHDVIAVLPAALVPYTPPDDGQRVHPDVPFVDEP